MSRGGAERAEKIVKTEHCNWPSAVTAPPRDQVFQLSNFFRASLVIPSTPCHPERSEGSRPWRSSNYLARQFIVP